MNEPKCKYFWCEDCLPSQAQEIFTCKEGFKFKALPRFFWLYWKKLNVPEQIEAK